MHVHRRVRAGGQGRHGKKLREFVRQRRQFPKLNCSDCEVQREEDDCEPVCERDGGRCPAGLDSLTDDEYRLVGIRNALAVSGQTLGPEVILRRFGPLTRTQLDMIIVIDDEVRRIDEEDAESRRRK